MKYKWWVVLLVLFLVAVLFSILISRQSATIVSVPQGEVQEPETKIEAWQAPAYSAAEAQTGIKPLPAIRRGITITKPAAAELKKENLNVNKIADKSTNKITGLSAPASGDAAVETQSAGVTKTGKLPTAKESQEMNSAGIVMY